jgi:hypothetical protein
MYDIKANIEENRLYITLGKFGNYEEMYEVASRIRDEANKLQRGFDALTDLRKYEVLGENYESLMKGIQQFLIEAGVSKVVRVVRKFGAWGHVQLDRASMDAGYHAEYVHSMEEALAILDKKQKS